jgi:hypothetical protein
MTTPRKGVRVRVRRRKVGAEERERWLWVSIFETALSAMLTSGAEPSTSVRNAAEIANEAMALPVYKKEALSL